MFTFAMITGVKKGWLDKKTYGEAARKGWLGLVSYIEPNADIRNVCQGTGKQNDLQYYLDRQRSPATSMARRRYYGALRRSCDSSNELQGHSECDRIVNQQLVVLCSC